MMMDGLAGIAKQEAYARILGLQMIHTKDLSVKFLRRLKMNCF